MNQMTLVEESPSAGTRYAAAAGVIIGREDCEIVLADPQVSRRHATIRSLGDALGIEDLGSTNGTSVNGQRLTGLAELKDGDVITIGSSALRVEVQVDAGATRLRPIQAAPAAEQPTQFRKARGDVPAPEPATASRVHQALSPVASPPRHAFDAGGTGGTRRGSAATRVEATVICYAIVVATVVAVILYVLAEKV